ncbi:hypothetical protein ACSMFX_26330 [Pseudomonas mosselii]|uniref:hypothetical protein n=1 Tax=Pseudomonas mosselii TaxID=78327 RepID=UPI003F1ABCE5
MAQFKAIEADDGQVYVVNRDYVVLFEPKYGDPKSSGYLSMHLEASRIKGFHVSKKDGEDVHQWLLKD